MHQRNTARVAGAIAAITAASIALAGCSAPPTEPDGPVTINWWGWDAFNAEQVVADFEADNPDISVEFRSVVYGDYVTTIRSALTANDGPDVFQLEPGGLVENFGSLAVPLDQPITEALGDDWKNLYSDQALAQLQLDGTQVALPSYMTGAGLIYYNATILDSLGLEVPADFSEWSDTCAALAAAGYDCLAHGAKDAWVNTDVFLAIVNSVAPGKVYEAIAGEVAWTDDDFVTAMSAWSELFTSGIIAPGSTALAEYPDAFTAFLEAKAAFIALGTWNTPGTMTKTGVAASQETVSVPIDSVYLSAPFPAAVAGDAPTELFGGPANGWAVSANSKQQAAALKFVEFLSAGGGQDIQASGGNLPALIDLAVSTDDVIDPSQAEDIQRQQESLSSIVGPRQIFYPDLAAAIGDALSVVAAGTMSPEDALAQVEAVSQGISR